MEFLALFLNLPLQRPISLPVWALRNSIPPYIPHFTPTTLDVILSDMPIGRGAPWIGRPPDGEPLSCGGILFGSILILPSLSRLPCPRSYRCGIYPSPPYPIYHILASSICQRTQRIRIDRTRKESSLILPILFFHHPTGGGTYELDNHLAA